MGVSADSSQRQPGGCACPHLPSRGTFWRKQLDLCSTTGGRVYTEVDAAQCMVNIIHLLLCMHAMHPSCTRSSSAVRLAVTHNWRCRLNAFRTSSPHEGWLPPFYSMQMLCHVKVHNFGFKLRCASTLLAVQTASMHACAAIKAIHCSGSTCHRVRMWHPLLHPGL